MPQSNGEAPPPPASAANNVESDNDRFEQLIDLGNLDNKNMNPLGDGNPLIGLEADLVNSNSMDNQPPMSSPLIAFEENSTAAVKTTTSTGKLEYRDLPLGGGGSMIMTLECV